MASLDWKESGVTSHLMTNKNDDVKMAEADVKFFYRKRYLVTFLTFIGFICSSLMRMNFSIAILEMTSDKIITSGNQTLIQKAEFDWNSKKKGFVLSLFFYGYMCSPLGGYLSTKHGGSTMFGLSVLCTAVLTILTPFVLRLNFFFFLIARIFEGIFEGFAVPAMIEIYVHWAPKQELSRMLMFAFNGIQIGLLISNPASAFITRYYGWPAIFFLTGTISLIWCFVWFMIISNHPLEDKFISRQEQRYFRHIQETTSVMKLRPYPWKNIITSKPFWALFNEHFSGAWSVSFMTVCMPLYVKDVFNQRIDQVALISSIPLLCGFITEIIVAILSDYLRSSSTLSIANVHRVFLGTGQLSIFVLLIIIGLWANATESIICISLIRIFFGISNVSYQIIEIDVFAGYASFIRGLYITAFSIGNLLNPTVMGFIVSNHSRSEWNMYFLLISVFNISSLIIFFVFGSGELQPWADTSENVEKRKNIPGTS